MTKRAGSGGLSILAITSMRNEGPYCTEWIAHHLAAGFTDFLIYSNDCDDGTDAILSRLDRAGVITHVPFSPSGERSVQWQVLRAARDHPALARADWAMFLDCDEFLNLRPPHGGLTDVIAALPQEAEAMALRWRLFGNSGHMEAPDELTIRAFDHAAPPGIALPLAHFFKTLFRPGSFAKPGVHRPKARKGTTPVWVDGSGADLGQGFAKAEQRINLYGVPAASDLVQLNHYSVRSAQAFMNKRARGLPNHMDREIGLGYWVERNFNAVRDDSIASMVPRTQAALESLLKISGLADDHARAICAHRDRFDQMMTDRGNIQLYWHLALASGSRPPELDFARAQVGRIRAAGEQDGK